jgi:hypothetical protein
MKNNYEASETFELGHAQDVVMGSKPFNPFEMDGFLGLWFQTNWSPDDIDENDD